MRERWRGKKWKNENRKRWRGKSGRKRYIEDRRRRRGGEKRVGRKEGEIKMVIISFLFLHSFPFHIFFVVHFFSYLILLLTFSYLS